MAVVYGGGSLDILTLLNFSISHLHSHFKIDIVMFRERAYELQDKEFVWDENKHKINKRKHGVSFEEKGMVL